MKSQPKRNMLHDLEWEIVSYWYPIYGPHPTSRRYQMTLRPCPGASFHTEGDTEQEAVDKLKRILRRVLRCGVADVQRLTIIGHHEHSMRELNQRKPLAITPAVKLPTRDQATKLAIEYGHAGEATLPAAKPGACTPHRYHETDKQLFVGWIWDMCPFCDRSVMIRTERRGREKCRCGAVKCHSVGQDGWKRGGKIWWSI